MSRAFWLTGLVLAGLVMTPDSSWAQPPGRKARPPFGAYQPAVSPYLSFGYNNIDPGFLYANFAQPQEQQNRANFELNRSLTSLGKQISKIGSFENTNAEIKRTITTTGHSTAFMNTAGFFPRR